MSSSAQIDANRANSEKSTGPITPEGKLASAANSALSTGPRTPAGKARSAQNARKHGILANSITLPEEDRDEFIRQLDLYKERFRPADELEERAVETMVSADWRRRRVWTFEMARLFYATLQQKASGDELAEQHLDNIPFLHAALAFGKMADSGRTLDLVCRYEALMRSQYSRARADLKELQADRRRREQDQLSDMEASLAAPDFVSLITKRSEANLETSPPEEAQS